MQEKEINNLAEQLFLRMPEGFQAEIINKMISIGCKSNKFVFAAALHKVNND